MWNCKNCNEGNEYGFESCWKCGYSKEGMPPENPQEIQKRPQSVKVERKRGWYITTWLVILAIVNLVLAGVYVLINVTFEKEGGIVFDGSTLYQMPPTSGWFFFIAVTASYTLLFYFTIQIIRWKKSAIYGYVITGIIRFFISLTKGGFSSIDHGSSGIGIFEVEKQSGIRLFENSISSFDNLWNLVAIMILLTLLIPIWKYFNQNGQLGKEKSANNISKIARKKRRYLKGYLILMILSSLYWIIRDLYYQTIQLLSLRSLPDYIQKNITQISIHTFLSTIFYVASIYFTFKILKRKKFGVYGYSVSLIVPIVIPAIYYASILYYFFHFDTAWNLLLIIILLVMILPIWNDFD